MTTSQVQTIPGRRLSPAQENYIRDLLAKVTGPERDVIRDSLNQAALAGTLTHRQVSEAIEALKALKHAQAAVVAASLAVYATIPEGHYALRGPDGVVRFYDVVRPTDQLTWVSLHASEERYAVLGAARLEVLQAIYDHPEAARKLYGDETNRCSFCNRELTDARSREVGSGPICSRKHGIDW